MDIDFFISALIFGVLASFKYWIDRKILKRKFHYLHCCYCALAGVGILTAFSALAYVSSNQGRPLIEASATTAIFVLAGFFTLVSRAKSTISSLSKVMV